MIVDRKILFKRSGIYKISTSINDKIYIGSSVNLYKRLSNHSERLRKNIHTNIVMNNHCIKYGYDVFSCEILEFCPIDNLIDREQYWLDFYQSYRYGFNIRSTAESNIGLKQSSETISKRSIALTGRSLSEEHCRKISEANTGMVSCNKGKTFSAEWRNKISISKTGVKITNLETLKRMSESRIGTKLGSEHHAHKKVYQFNLDGEFIKEWNGCGEVQRSLNIQQVNIAKTCRGERKSAGGFKWSYDKNAPGVQIEIIKYYNG